ncbi:MAG: glycoside hydrolase family 15 protein [Actinomycetota bacterium]|nr:glycoside hydrolase family 15 protein [Actinomycetota bacterium]
MITNADRVPLGARAWIADGTRGALVAADGTIDWYAPDRFDAPADLYRLLDRHGGYLRVGPVRTGTGAWRRLPDGVQSYRPGTNIAELHLTGAGAPFRLVDFLPWPGPGGRPDGRIVRIATALAGPVDIEVELSPGHHLGPARQVSAFAEGVVFDRAILRTGFPLEAVPIDRDHTVWRGIRRLAAGESLVVTLDSLDSELHQPLSTDAALRLADITTTAWRSWLAPLSYRGLYRDAVERSLLALRSLIGYRVGAPVAAGTTSLPRRAGGQRLDDGRFIRWRDAASVAMLLGRAGFGEEAEAAEAWLRAAVSSTELPWPVALDVDGGPAPPLEEWSLDGWRHSQPVVTGRPSGRVDLGLHAEVAHAVSASVAPGGRGPLSGAWPALVAATDWLADHWSQPDHGIWGPACDPELLVSSRLATWRALDRMTRLAQTANPFDLVAAAWHQEAGDVLHSLERDAIAPDGGLLRVMTPGDGPRRATAPDDRPDAALLPVAWQGPWPSTHPIVLSTVDRILGRLSSGPFVSRHGDDVDDGYPGADSPDLLVSLWAVRALAVLERWDEAHDRMASICEVGGGLGLLSEAVDPLSGELLGNLPSSGTHLALIEAALALEAGPG